MNKFVLRKVRTEYGKSIRKAYESGRVYEKRSNMTQYEPRFDGLSNTITTVQQDNYVLETGGIMEKYEDGNLRIRKLTPKECFRLMGFDDESFHKAEQVNSNTQLYKQAGNSIVVDVAEYIIKAIYDCGVFG